MEIERKYTIKKMPEDLESYENHKIIQAYLCKEPVVRIRRSDDEYYMTYKGKGLVAREEYNLNLTKEAFDHLLPKADGNVISKTRYVIPIENPRFMDNYKLSEDIKLCIELDIFGPPVAPLIMAEVEFPDIECANAYIPEDWFDEDVSGDKRYHNVNMAYGL
ncbi:MAG: CYTH domain-containing protein [Lachnospiraceae bacterium]|nr:CYTH domain-containing protein [Lachnospiraceae bacterium]